LLLDASLRPWLALLGWVGLRAVTLRTLKILRNRGKFLRLS